MPNWRQSTKSRKVELYSEATLKKDDSGSYAVFTEQGSSASQMTAAKVMDIISRLPGCAGQAADAVSAYTQVKMEDAHKLFKVPQSECPDLGIRLRRHKMAKVMGKHWRPRCSSWEIYTDTHPLVSCEKDGSKNLYWNLDREKRTELGMLLCSQKTTTISFQYTWMILTWLERRRIWLWCGRKLMQNVDFDETISFLDYVYLECTQRECKQNEIIIGKNLTQRPWRGPTTWKDTLKKCVERYCELANKKTEQLHKVSSPCLDDHQTEVYSQTV